MASSERDVVDPERLITRWLFDLQQRVQQIAERTGSGALERWADQLRTQVTTWAAGETAPRPHRLGRIPALDDPLDAWITARLVASAKASDGVAGLAELGLSSQQIANAHGSDISDSAVQYYAKRVHQMTFTPSWRTPAFIEAMRDAHDRGLTPRTIAARAQLSRKTIERLVGPLPGRRQRRLARLESARSDDELV